MRLIYTLLLLILLLSVSGCGGSGGDDATSNTSLTPLTEHQKFSLAFMWHEEKLAYDIYLALNTLHPSSTLANIANNSESQHIAMVEDLVKRYDINITNLHDYEINYSQAELRAMPAGTFIVPDIQNLYDTLYTQGTASLLASYEVGCKVEVTDVEDLAHYITIAEGNTDLISTFQKLREGSYKHYWAFDAAIIGLGVATGCCSLDSAYCQPQYPR